MTDYLPFLNRRIVVTRSEEQSGSITSELTKLGAIVLVVPTIRIEPARLSAEDISLLNKFHDYDFVIFTSVNAVRNFFHFFKPDTTLRRRPVIISIGSKTMSAVQEFGLTPDFVPPKFNAVELLNSLQSISLKGKRVLIPKGNLSGNEIAGFVRDNGGTADEVAVYRTLPNDSIDEHLKSEIASKNFDMVIFFSPSQVKNFLDVFGIEVLKSKLIAVIGPTTRRAAEHFELDVDIVPENSTTEDLIASLIEHEKIGK